MKIHKYYINGHGMNKIDCFPGEWVSAAVDSQGNLVCYREENDETESTTTWIYALFTGDKVPGDNRLLGTVVQGSLVWHIYRWL